MAQVGDEERQANIEKSKKMQLNAQSPSVLLQGHLLKRSETVRCPLLADAIFPETLHKRIIFCKSLEHGYDKFFNLDCLTD
jgi:hypothetical protein